MVGGIGGSVEAATDGMLNCLGIMCAATADVGGVGSTWCVKIVPVAVAAGSDALDCTNTMPVVLFGGVGSIALYDAIVVNVGSSGSTLTYISQRNDSIRRVYAWITLVYVRSTWIYT